MSKKDKGGSNPPFLYRCQTCGKLLGDEMIAKGICTGHQFKYANNGTVWEWIQIKILKRIK